MRVLILGAAGFLGSRLCTRLAAEGRLADRPIDELVLFDLRPAQAPAQVTCKLTVAHGDLRERCVLDGLFGQPVDAIFHLAATLTLDAETDFRRGLETNVLALVDLLERCRAQPLTTMLLFASSISTFGGTLPAVVDDDVFQAPTTSYGAHKVIAEQLLADYSRHGFVDGRALRLPIVLTHPGPASGSVSDQVACLIREPLRGRRTTCRMGPDSRLVVSSVDNVVESFLRLASIPAGALQGMRIMNLPGLTVTPARIVHAVARHLPPGSDDLVDWRPDPAVQRIIDGWPTGFTSRHALSLGFAPDASVDALVGAFLASDSGRA